MWNLTISPRMTLDGVITVDEWSNRQGAPVRNIQTILFSIER